MAIRANFGLPGSGQMVRATGYPSNVIRLASDFTEEVFYTNGTYGETYGGKIETFLFFGQSNRNRHC